MHHTTSQDAPCRVRLAKSTSLASTSPESTDTDGGAERPPRLLIVEDDQMTGVALSRMFRRLGWDVLVSMTVAGGLSLLETRPDCAFLDLNLPDGDGDTVLAAIREAGLAIRVVVASGTSDRDHLERVERLGPEGLLRKPVVLDEILQAFGVAG